MGNKLEGVAQCNAEQGCTHMEWGLNGHGQNQCVIFAPHVQQAPAGWTFVLGNGDDGSASQLQFPWLWLVPQCRCIKISEPLSENRRCKQRGVRGAVQCGPGMHPHGVGPQRSWTEPM